MKGLFQIYNHTHSRLVPTWVPKHEERLDFISDVELQPPPICTEPVHEISCDMPADPFTPFPNLSVTLYMATYFSRMDTKSEEHTTMVAKTMQDPRFSTEEMTGFNAHIENVRLDKYLKGDTHPFQEGEGWHQSTVHICLPVEGEPVTSEALPIGGVFHR